ncbi:MAG: heme exporter protein CcmB, partial [Paracoccaceae bacterium]
MMALLMRDLKLAFRAGGGFGFAILFFFIVTLLLAFGIGPDVVLLGKIAPGALWV